ncbi:hypothetical protein Enr13x_56040 [Stieleria neptunia]|uniref:Uncharacterized protein n=1 Tax=Stieleria neptunia TaxID=2527979 RepID=A0A518HXZ8_9BACT|nr:hypothetical protein [Stieleria neptunia]QDV45725.1 hypothetical protein Enr13x_56040 [Stieleria neptunia]
MTQMMLFDPCSLAPSTPVAVNPAAVTASTVTASPVVSRSRTAPSAAASNTPRGSRNHAEADDGIHRMGDLARLVLLRYQLVAQRRQEMAARRGN